LFPEFDRKPSSAEHNNKSEPVPYGKKDLVHRILKICLEYPSKFIQNPKFSLLYTSVINNENEFHY